MLKPVNIYTKKNKSCFLSDFLKIYSLTFGRAYGIAALKYVIGDFSADEFDDGAELLKSHAEKPYDLIILDILIPKISGMDTAEILRKTDTETPIVFFVNKRGVWRSELPCFCIRLSFKAD